MSSIKDKLKSKIKSRIQQPQTMESFDENAVSVTISQGKNQLSEIRLQCSWNSKNNMKNPRLKCRWYNRTQNNLQEISGVEDQNYQPSILDVGSIIQITCQPELPGISYEGMPIQLKSNLITLASETQNESTHLIALGKAKFFIELKEAKIKGRSISHGCDSMIKIDGYKMVLCQMKFGQLNDDVVKECTIDEFFPQIIINRRHSREITLRFAEEQSCIINFKNHQVRDVFSLFNKLMVAKLNTNKDLQAQAQMACLQSIERTPTKTKDPESQLTSIQKIERKKSEQLNPPATPQTKADSVLIPKSLPKVQIISKPSAADILQLSNLRQQIKQIQACNLKLTKQLETEREKNYNLQNKIVQLNERMQNVSRNYFQLQRQLKNSQEQLINFKKNAQDKVDKDNGKDEEMLYYRNQIKIISDERKKMVQTIEQLTKANQTLLIQVQNYREIYNASEQHKSFVELEEEMKVLKKMNNELKMKYEYSMEQKDKMEEDLKSSRNLIEQIEAQKKHIQKRYESLTNQLSSPTLSMSKLSDNKSNGQSSLSNSYVFEEMPSLDRRQSSKSSFTAQYDFRQRQILQLKKQLKDLVEENGYVRTLLSKQKKPSSKTQLKLELFEVKKIVNRLSQAMIEKDMCINNLKQINKQLNKKNADLLSTSASLVRSSV